MKTNSQKSKVYFISIRNGFLILFLLAFLLLLECCAPLPTTATDTPTLHKSTSAPSNIASPAATPSPTGNSLPTSIFEDVRENLLPGAHIVYWSQNIWHIRNLEVFDEPSLLPDLTSNLYTVMELSPDENLVAFSNVKGRLSIYDLRTGNIRSFINPAIEEIMEIVWAKDGKMLYYLGTPEEIWWPDTNVGMYGLSLTNEETFTFVDWHDSKFEYNGLKGLTLSKDGRWLAFYAPRKSELMAPDPEYAIYLMDTNCSQNNESCMESITLVADGRNPAWSPSDKLGWVCSDESQNALCVLDPNEPQSNIQIFLTANDISITQGSEFDNFSWSPDGRYIAINLNIPQTTSAISITQEILLFSLDKHQSIKVTDLPDKDEVWVGWSPDSRYLVYTRTLGLTNPYGSIGVRFPVTDIFIYDLQNGAKIDLIERSGDREVFSFFLIIK